MVYKELAEPFSHIFRDVAEATWAFDWLRETATRLGIRGAADQRFALTLTRRGGKPGLHLSFGPWLVLGFQGRARVELPLLTDRVAWDERLADLPSEPKESRPDIRSYHLPRSLVRPLSSDLQAAYEDTLALIAEKFRHWQRATPWKQHRTELIESLFDPDKRAELFAGGLTEPDMLYERQLTTFYDVNEGGAEDEKTPITSEELPEPTEVTFPHLDHNRTTNQMKIEFRTLFQEFLETYVDTPDGQRHIIAYPKGRREGRQNFKEVLDKAANNEDVTDLVLLKFLPYNDSASNRKRGAWVHIAPTIRGDVKGWFEGSGWTKPEDWPKIAQAILNFTRRCNEDPHSLAKACQEFSDLPYSKGFQSGMLSPILNALQPDKFLIINNKSRNIINHFANTTFTQKLTDYPDINAAGRELVAELTGEIDHFDNVPDLRYEDLFDMFCHWLVAVRGQDFKQKETSQQTDTISVNEELSEYSTEEWRSDIFSPETFILLAELHQNPSKEIYLDKKEAFKTHVEEPLQQLFQAVAGRLPPPIIAAMETEKKIFGRILKNDYGQGGAWDFYWGAFYRRGGKRTEDAQLLIWINSQGLEYGFYIGVYGSDERKRFLRNVNREAQAVRPLLRSDLSDPTIVYGSREDYEAGVPSPAFETWLDSSGETDIRATFILGKDEVLRLSLDTLAEKIAADFARLFPLVLLAIKDDPLPAISHYLGLVEEEEIDRQPPYPLPDLAAETGFEEADLGRWVRAIERKGQAILYGPPGTGKTYLAEHLARHLIGGGDGFKELVQFHPAYAYEDFMQGIRPESEGAQLSYPMKPGRFLDFCRRAEGRETCVLIIDEINRANLARVFGELMYLLEYRAQTIRLAGDGAPFTIPANVRLIGTMNTADRSIALVDHALRRRFAFIRLWPTYDLLRRFHEQHDTSFPVEGLIGVLQTLNQRIEENYQIGITFFLHENLGVEIEDIWRMEIEPYLEEYFFGQPEVVAEFRWARVKGEIGP